MAKVVFWSPESSMTGNTLSAIAVSTVMGITRKARCILINSYLNTRKIESSYTPYYELKESGALDNSNIGIGAITRLVVSNKLSADTIKNYAKPVLKDRLDILYGMSSKDAEQYTQMVNNMAYMLRKSDEIYDVVFVDIPKTTNEKYIKDVLTDADVVVCVVNQDVLKLEEFFSTIAKEETLKDKNKIFVIGNYEEKSKYNVANIRSRYKIKEPIYEVPSNYLFADACNDGNVIDFFYKNMNADKRDYNGDFIFKVSSIAEKILEVAKIKDI